MGIFDKVTEAVASNAEAVKGGIDKVGDFIDEKTGGQYADKIDQAQDFVQGQVDKMTGEQQA